MTTRPLLAALVRGASWPLIRHHVTRRLEGVAGLENIPAEGGVVVTPNHLSYYDHFVMLTLLRRVRPGQKVWFVTKAEAFCHAPSRIWHESWHSIPVDRQCPAPSTVKTIRDRLLAGEVVCIYPEGTRNPDAGLLDFKDGAFRFADLAGVPVVPVGMDGTADVLPRGVTRPQPGRVRVAFGAPLVSTATGRRARTGDLLVRGRASVELLLQQASTPGFGPTAGNATAAVVDQQVTDGLDTAGRLPASLVRRYDRLLRVARDSGSRSTDLDVQRVRLAGLAAMNRRGPARLATALPLGPRLHRIIRADPDHGFAHYLLARWQLLAPATMGGGGRRARSTFDTAARLAPSGDTRALSGLSDACRSIGDVTGAREALQRLIHTTTPEGRGAARIARARTALNTLKEGAA